MQEEGLWLMGSFENTIPADPDDILTAIGALLALVAASFAALTIAMAVFYIGRRTTGEQTAAKPTAIPREWIRHYIGDEDADDENTDYIIVVVPDPKSS